MNYKLNKQQYMLLLDALRRYSRFAVPKGIPLDGVWTGVGSTTEYKPVHPEFMKQVFLEDKEADRNTDVWWILTEAGQEIVQTWFDHGWRHQHVERRIMSDLPPKKVREGDSIPQAPEIQKTEEYLPDTYERVAFHFPQNIIPKRTL